MPRAAVLVVLMLSMLWQSIALARIGSSVNVLADAAHAALHWHETAHHHHDDGSYHLVDAAAPGEAADAAQHVLTDPVGASTALLMASMPGFPAAGSLRPLMGPPGAWPEHALDGLLRPPRPHA